jgi:hypothetical protein
MLVSRRDDRILLIEQNEHGRVAGEICARWGNARFPRPPRHPSALIAAASHDDGWREADAAPLFNSAAARPLHFLEIEMAEHVPLYRRGVERVCRRDQYAGLLVSMHWTGLYRGRWGLQTGGVFSSAATAEAARLQDAAIDEQEQQWIAIKRDLMREEPRIDFEVGLWHNYALLQAFDLLSLFVCAANLAPGDGAPPRLLTDVLGSIVQEPGARVVKSVPLAPDEQRVDLLLEPTAAGVVVVDPYPFDQDPVQLSVSGPAIPDQRYESQDAVRDALAHATDVTFGCSLTSRRA